jgi:hypothetical protein
VHSCESCCHTPLALLHHASSFFPPLFRPPFLFFTDSSDLLGSQRDGRLVVSWVKDNDDESQYDANVPTDNVFSFFFTGWCRSRRRRWCCLDTNRTADNLWLHTTRRHSCSCPIKCSIWHNYLSVRNSRLCGTTKRRWCQQWQFQGCRHSACIRAGGRCCRLCAPLGHCTLLSVPLVFPSCLLHTSTCSFSCTSNTDTSTASCCCPLASHPLILLSLFASPRWLFEASKNILAHLLAPILGWAGLRRRMTRAYVSRGTMQGGHATFGTKARC